MMNYKLPFFILVVGVTALGLIAFSPAIYAAIEPHITIMMDPGQTTNPFVIKDDLNNDIFRIHPDGQIFPEQDGWTSLHYHSVATQIVDISDYLETSPFVVAEWTLTYEFPTDTGTEAIFRADNTMISNIKRVSGGGTCTFAVQTLEFGTWTDWLVVSRGSSLWGTQTQETNSNAEFNVDGVRWVYYTGASTNCQFRNTAGIYEILSSPDVTVTRVI